MELLPRRLRNLQHPGGQPKRYLPFVHNLIRASIPRSQRLFCSSDELECEIEKRMPKLEGGRLNLVSGATDLTLVFLGKEAIVRHKSHPEGKSSYFVTRAKDLTFVCL